MSSPKTEKDLGVKLVAILSEDAHTARSFFLKRKVRDAEDQKYRDRCKAKQFLVKGRSISGGAVVWDVFQLDGDSSPKAVGGDFVFQEEAIAFARDRSLGRMSVSFGGIRGLFKAGTGGIVRTDKSIELPNQKSVSIRNTKHGILVG